MTTTMEPQRPDPTTYAFNSQPKAVSARRKYRDHIQQNADGEVVNYGNIMYDRRVVRGNTYALHVLPADAQPDPIEMQQRQENLRRARARRRAKDKLRPRTPDAVEGRKHVAVQTELYLEELSDRVEEADVDCQTDAFLDRPPSPLFVPAKTGLDVETQILEGDLFDFDIEVKPILEVIVGKTLEQSLLEVLEEEELHNLRAQQRAFEELRNAELVEQQRLEEQERRHREEKERRMEQQRKALLKEKETADKVAALAYTQAYLRDLLPAVYGTLIETGYFFDTIEKDVEQNFMPWLMDRVADHLERQELGRLVLDGMLREVVHRRRKLYRRLERAGFNVVKSTPDKKATPAEEGEEAPADAETEDASAADKEPGEAPDTGDAPAEEPTATGGEEQAPAEQPTATGGEEAPPPQE
ncbi:radial spoke head protein 3 homolog B-like [Babylonia areolata]|uniref:radial spoke head protein 3 homolog B-like n=1 Tax=Babylonia areolata TaxID=304850 RepID=UPI003FD17FDA